MSVQHSGSLNEDSGEIPVEEALRRARPLPAFEDMLIDGLSDEEEAAFVAAINT